MTNRAGGGGLLGIPSVILAAAIVLAGCAHTPEPDPVDARIAELCAEKSRLDEEMRRTELPDADGFCAIDANGLGVLRTRTPSPDDPEWAELLERMTRMEAHLKAQLEALRAGECVIDSNGVQVVPDEPGASDGK